MEYIDEDNNYSSEEYDDNYYEDYYEDYNIYNDENTYNDNITNNIDKYLNKKYIIMYNKWHDYSIKFIRYRQKENIKNIPFNKLEYNLLNMQGGSLHTNGTRTPRSNSYSKYGYNIWNNINTQLGVDLEKEQEPTPRNYRSSYIKNINNIKEIIDYGNTMNFYINLDLYNNNYITTLKQFNRKIKLNKL